MTGFPVLTVQQPWAAAIAFGAKDVENRDWQVKHRGLLWIHAGKQVDWGASERAWTAAGLTPPPAEGRFHRSAWTASLALGAVVALVDVTGCHGPGERDRCSPWAVLWSYHVTLADPRPLLSPVPCRGALGLWRLPADVEQACLAQVHRPPTRSA